VEDGELNGAIEFAQQHLALYDSSIKIPASKEEGEELISVQDVLGLFCYEDPKNSELGYLMSERQRHAVANFINNELLKFGNKLTGKLGAESNLERICKQLTATREELRRVNEGAGRMFRLRVDSHY